MGMDVQQGRNTSSSMSWVWMSNKEETHHQDNHLKMVMRYDHKIQLANDIPKRRHDYMQLGCD
jgi:hypothetical protein